MKNAFKFGFLALAIAVGTAACNSANNNETEATVDSLENVIEERIETTTDSIDSIGEELIDSLDSLAN